MAGFVGCRSRRGRRDAGLLARLRSARVAVDRVDRDSIAAAKLAARCGAHVTLVPTRVDEQALESERAELRHAGVRVAATSDGAPPGDCAVLLAHDYTSPNEPWIRDACTRGVTIAHFADLLLELSPAVAVGVTGSAGKSTTSTMIATMLEASGRHVLRPRRPDIPSSLNPNWELLDAPEAASADAVLVLELTSSHLEHMVTSPDVGVVTTISADHLEWHGSLARYLEAKRRIFALQGAGDCVVLNANDPVTRAWAADAPGRVAFAGRGPARGDGVWLDGDRVELVDGAHHMTLARRDELGLAAPYAANAAAAAAAALAAGATTHAVASTLRTFTGLPAHRELVAAKDGVAVYNDGVAVTPRKAIASLDSFPDGSVLLVCGGSDHEDGWSVAPMHSDPEEQELLMRFVALATRKARRVYVLGPARARLRDPLLALGYPGEAICEPDSVEEALVDAIAAAEGGETVLLAPAFGLRHEEIDRFSAVARNVLGVGARA